MIKMRRLLGWRNVSFLSQKGGTPSPIHFWRSLKNDEEENLFARRLDKGRGGKTLA